MFAKLLIKSHEEEGWAEGEEGAACRCLGKPVEWIAERRGNCFSKRAFRSDKVRRKGDGRSRNDNVNVGDK